MASGWNDHEEQRPLSGWNDWTKYEKLVTYPVPAFEQSVVLRGSEAAFRDPDYEWIDITTMGDSDTVLLRGRRKTQPAYASQMIRCQWCGTPYRPGRRSNCTQCGGPL